MLGCDLARVVELDNTVRHQIPGTNDWTGNIEDLRRELADDEFDPELYLVAVHRTTGSYDGLVRIWNRHPRPRLECVGVRPEWRRTRLGPALLAEVAATLGRRGVSEILTETELANRDSYPMAARGGSPQQRIVQWVRAGAAPRRGHARRRAVWGRPVQPARSDVASQITARRRPAPPPLGRAVCRSAGCPG